METALNILKAIGTIIALGFAGANLAGFMLGPFCTPILPSGEVSPMEKDRPSGGIGSVLFAVAACALLSRWFFLKGMPLLGIAFWLSFAQRAFDYLHIRARIVWGGMWIAGIVLVFAHFLS